MKYLDQIEQSKLKAARVGKLIVEMHKTIKAKRQDWIHIRFTRTKRTTQEREGYYCPFCSGGWVMPFVGSKCRCGARVFDTFSAKTDPYKLGLFRDPVDESK